MKQIGNFYVLENQEELKNRGAYLKDKITIQLSVYPNPERVWGPPSDEKKPGWPPYPERLRPSNNEMIAHAHEKNRKLKELGLLSDEVLAQFQDCESHVCVATEFSDLETAKEVFEKACRAGIVDIYLEQDCKHVMKYD